MSVLQEASTWLFLLDHFVDRFLISHFFFDLFLGHKVPLHPPLLYPLPERPPDRLLLCRLQTRSQPTRARCHKHPAPLPLISIRFSHVVSFILPPVLKLALLHIGTVLEPPNRLPDPFAH